MDLHLLVKSEGLVKGDSISAVTFPQRYPRSLLYPHCDSLCCVLVDMAFIKRCTISPSKVLDAATLNPTICFFPHFLLVPFYQEK